MSLAFSKRTVQGRGKPKRTKKKRQNVIEDNVTAELLHLVVVPWPVGASFFLTFVLSLSFFLTQQEKVRSQFLNH